MNVDKNLQPRDKKWPFDGDSPLARARRIAHMYRQGLYNVDPDSCAELDQRAKSLGEEWAAPRLVHYEDDQWLRPVHAADYLCVKPDALRLLRNRGRLTGKLIDGVWHYRVAELRKVAEKRPRGESCNTPPPSDTVRGSTEGLASGQLR